MSRNAFIGDVFAKVISRYTILLISAIMRHHSYLSQFSRPFSRPSKAEVPIQVAQLLTMLESCFLLLISKFKRDLRYIRRATVYLNTMLREQIFRDIRCTVMG